MSQAVVLPVPDLRKFVTDLFMEAGMVSADAAQVADVLIWAERRAVGSHGVSRIPRYLELIASGAMDPRAVPRLRKEFGACFVLQANRAAGAVAMMRATDQAMAVARRAGIGFGAIAGTTHVGAIGRYAQLLAEHDFIAIVAAAGIPNMAYHGARVASLSTSPIAIGIPARPTPLLLDMASSVMALGRLRQAKAEPQTLPAGSALTHDGQPTTDPTAAVIPLPLGGPKGSGLSLMLECLCGILAGAPILSAMLKPDGDRTHRQNACVIAISVAAVTELAEFSDAINDLSNVIHALPRQDEVAELLLPGERGERVARHRDQHGVPIPLPTWRALVYAAETMGVTIPKTAQSLDDNIKVN